MSVHDLHRIKIVSIVQIVKLKLSNTVNVRDISNLKYAFFISSSPSQMLNR